MTSSELAIPSALTADDVQRHLPDGWFIRDWRATIYAQAYPWESRELELEFIHVDTGTSVAVRFRAMPDWAWFSAFLVACEGRSRGVFVQVDNPNEYP